MLSKVDYEMIAGTLNVRLRTLDALCKFNNSDANQLRYLEIQDFANELMRVFKRDNPRFKEKEFRKFCLDGIDTERHIAEKEKQNG